MPALAEKEHQTIGVDCTDFEFRFARVRYEVAARLTISCELLVEPDLLWPWYAFWVPTSAQRIAAIYRGTNSRIRYWCG